MAHLIPDTITHDFERGAVVARFDVDGAIVKARITDEAVQDAFGARTTDRNEMQRLVSENSAEIAAVVAAKHRAGQTDEYGWVCVRSEDLR